MKIRELRALRGPNYYSQLPVIFMKLELGELENRPSDTVSDMRERLERMMPTLYKHTCSPGVEGGFFQRIERGTWAGHIAEHIAIELQVLIGHDITFGKTFTLKEKGVYDVVFRYKNEAVGLRAAQLAVQLTDALFQGETPDITPILIELRRLDTRTALGPTTRSITEEARRRGIATMRLNEHSFVQLGHGKYQRRIVATLLDDTSSLGVDIAANKQWTKQLLQERGIPVPIGQSVKSIDAALRTANKIGYPVAVKPYNGNHGRGVSTQVNDDEALKQAFELAQGISQNVVIEQHLTGFDYRLLLIDHKLQATALREPAHVTGNGKDSISQLIDILNEDPQRGVGHENNLTRITVDQETEHALQLQELTLEHIPEQGAKIYIKQTANLSSGGTARTVTDVHPSIRRMAERVSWIIGLNVMGIDLIAPWIDRPLDPKTAGIVEVNAGPGFRMHLHPTEGEPVNVAAPVLDMLFPPGRKHTIPICAVTGTNGKTTTTRLIAQILRRAGYTVGMTSTDVVSIDEEPILYGDYSGPSGAETILKDPTVDAAVLEVARGGILRRGLGFQYCDVGVLLNVTSDHLGLGGIDTLEELTRVKSTVTETARRSGWAVFNADDAMSLSAAPRAKARIILFSKKSSHPALIENVQKGNVNVTLDNGDVILQTGDQSHVVARVLDIPVTFGGKALFNVENVMAAVAASYGLGLSVEQIREGLFSFHSSIEQSPGRMNLIEVGDFHVLIDYGHNVAATHATGDFMMKLQPAHIIRMAAGVGDRRNEDLIGFGEAIAKYGHHIFLSDPTPRGRAPGQTAELIKQGLLRGGLHEDQVTLVQNEVEATRRALETAGPGDLVVLQVENIARVTTDVLAFKDRLETDRKDT